MTKKAADDIAEKMAISVEAVYKKITSLRTQYSRLINALPSGCRLLIRTN